MCVELKQQLKNSGISVSDMQARADDVLKFFEIDSLPEAGVPIVAILNRIGIRVFRDTDLAQDFSAYIAIDPRLEERFATNKIVCVNDNDPVGHKRFSLAHELAHYLFDFDESVDTKYYNTYLTGDANNQDEIEIRANQFAACFLMPRKWFLSEFEKIKNELDKPATINLMARRFGVSPKCASMRFSEVGIDGYEL